MEIVRNTAELGKLESKNYLVRGWQLMVKKAKQGIEKAEENKTRTQFWVTIAVAISIPILVPLCSWFSMHLMNFGAQQARQEMFDKETQRLEKIIADKDKEIQLLQEKKQSEDVKTVQPKPKPKPAQQTTRNRSRQNSSVRNGEIADPSNKIVDIADLSKEKR